MDNLNLFDMLPIWAIYLLTVALGLLSVEVGYRVGRNWKARHPDEDESNTSTMIAATLGLWAFFLAFLVGMATNRFDKRLNLVELEANSIGTTYLRTGYLPEPVKSQSRELLREYTNERLKLIEPETHGSSRSRMEAIQPQLWKMAQELAIENPNPLMAAYVTALNETIDLHTSRIVALTTARIPFTIYASIFLVAMLGLVMLGYQNGVKGKRNFFVTLVLILVFSGVMLMVIDLDRPWGGLLRVSQQPLIDLISSFDSYK